MKWLKREEQRVMQSFADTQLHMDARFKQKLRKQIVAASRQPEVRKRGLLAGWSVPKLVLAPAMLFGLIVVGGLVLFNNGGPQGPAAPQKVSAAEIIDRSRQYYASLDVSSYNFYSYSDTIKRGPKYAACQPFGLGITEGTYAYYNYWSKDSKTEASYTREESPENGVREASYYSENGTTLHDTYADRLDREIWIGTLKVADKLAYIIVDKAGRPIQLEDVPVTEREGRDVYTIYARDNTEVVSEDCPGKITEYVFDARTYAAIEAGSFIGTVSEENLILRSQNRESFRTVSEAEAVRIMTEAGFDKEQASSQLRPLAR